MSMDRPPPTPGDMSWIKILDINVKSYLTDLIARVAYLTSLLMFGISKKNIKNKDKSNECDITKYKK